MTRSHSTHDTQGHDHTHEHSHDHGHHGADFDWEALATHLEHEAEVNRPVYEQAAAWIAQTRGERVVRRVLDIGSGPGLITCMLAEAFPDAEVVAVDSTPALLDRARARAERSGLGERVRTLVAEVPGELGSLGEADLVWAANSLHHVGDQRAALTGFAGLLRPGGTVALFEGGLSPRHLPRDIGIGRPGLEARLEVAWSERFTQMREELPGSKPEVEDWRALLTAAGLTPDGSRSFLLDLPAPLPDAARELVVETFARQREVFADRLTAQDVATLDRLLDARDAAGLAQRPDVFMLRARTLHIAHRA
ncbi:SAM-dependent methyltransferase [Streptomyces agglomeratus]|uniref:SAM-dependent methyltransferase n=1 Tax=Streptomyces agglomeratus TaxID=285458 RepID=A0A1E5P3R7_9ACTN|nr:methyltransferase domain-containing protein [Streptomyces agglomeratus]OEJ24186.1 SAM-dependent methyltransferase [Streptomyces agglomeratus]OEJ41808.1 SAM-dependent methyltransferase [Streptomyces agglomeratus]OEJ43814.1 SAM-dependent methyltransferase [Streptomyces agglomeratus]OEJ54300.1 SAM-dependent methyltransferase [Streptomyces agglomeratus]